MQRSDTYGIIHAANYAALCIAILRPAPTSVEDAFSLYESGKPEARVGRGHRLNHRERVTEIFAMRKTGMSWTDIGAVLGLKAPNCYFSRNKHLLGGEGQ